jgi:hypothetical protein
MNKIKSAHRECRNGHRKFNPSSGEKLPPIFKNEVPNA